MPGRRTIDANGNLVPVEDGATTMSSGSGGDGQSLMSSLQSMQNVDVFGFNVPSRQFYIGLAVIGFMFGLRSGELK